MHWESGPFKDFDRGPFEERKSNARRGICKSRGSSKTQNRPFNGNKDRETNEYKSTLYKESSNDFFSSI